MKFHRLGKSGSVVLAAVLGTLALSSGTKADTERMVIQNVPESGGRCLAVPDGQLADGTRMQVWDCNGSPAQIFVYDNQTRELKLGTDCVESLAQGGQNAVAIGSCNGAADQQWTMVPVANRDVYQVIGANGLCLDITRAPGVNGTPLDVLACDTAKPVQLWVMLAPPDAANADVPGTPAANPDSGSAAQSASPASSGQPASTDTPTQTADTPDQSPGDTPDQSPGGGKAPKGKKIRLGKNRIPGGPNGPNGPQGPAQTQPPQPTTSPGNQPTPASGSPLEFCIEMKNPDGSIMGLSFTVTGAEGKAVSEKVCASGGPKNGQCGQSRGTPPNAQFCMGGSCIPLESTNGAANVSANSALANFFGASPDAQPVDPNNPITPGACKPVTTTASKTPKTHTASIPAPTPFPPSLFPPTCDLPGCFPPTLPPGVSVPGGGAEHRLHLVHPGPLSSSVPAKLTAKGCGSCCGGPAKSGTSKPGGSSPMPHVRQASLTPSGQHVTQPSTTHRSSSYGRGPSSSGHHSRGTSHHRSGSFHTSHAGGRVHSVSHGVSHGGRRRSDIRLKEDIVLLGRLANGLGLYRFRYKGDDRMRYVGVMAQEVQAVAPGAVSPGGDGYLRVDYDQLGVTFLTWDEWLARSGVVAP